MENILVIYFTFLSDSWLLRHSNATTMSFATTLIVQQITMLPRLFAIGIMIPNNSFNSSLPSYSFCSYRGKYSWPRIGQKCFLYLIWNSCQYYNRHFHMMSYIKQLCRANELQCGDVTTYCSWQIIPLTKHLYNSKSSVIVRVFFFFWRVI